MQLSLAAFGLTICSLSLFPTYIYMVYILYRHHTAMEHASSSKNHVYMFSKGHHKALYSCLKIFWKRNEMRMILYISEWLVVWRTTTQ